MVRIALVGGGSGGHFYPLIAVAEAIRNEARAKRRIEPELYYMGPDPYDAGALFEVGAVFVAIPAGKRRRYFSIRNISDLFLTFMGALIALFKLFRLYPDVVLSKGGYTSVPVIIAARLLRIPVVIHESDATPGRANLLAASYARYIGVSYRDALGHFPSEKTELVGIPMRQKILGSVGRTDRRALGIQSEKPIVLVLGGSQGAERINDLVIGSLDELLPRYVVVHQTGERHTNPVKESSNALVANKELLKDYFVNGFFDAATLGSALGAASIVVSRAGSGTIHEIALYGKPSILIPIPEEISHDQRTNAYAYAREGAASVIEERNVTPHLLTSEVARIMGDSELQRKMAVAASAFAPRDAAAKLAEVLIGIGYEHGS